MEKSGGQAPGGDRVKAMTIQCPYCWEFIETEEIPYSEEAVELVLDCEVCCRPIALRVTWQGDDEPLVETRAES